MKEKGKMDFKKQKSKEELSDDLERAYSYDIEQVCKHLQNNEIEIQSFFADFISSLCNIEKADILNIKKKKSHFVYARWLLWYSYRYMTGESYISMGNSKIWEETNSSTIRYGVLRMGDMIEREPIWARRWSNIKGLIDSRNDSMKGEKPEIVLNVPRGIKDKINVTIKYN